MHIYQDLKYMNKVTGGISLDVLCIVADSHTETVYPLNKFYKQRSPCV